MTVSRFLLNALFWVIPTFCLGQKNYSIYNRKSSESIIVKTPETDKKIPVYLFVDKSSDTSTIINELLATLFYNIDSNIYLHLINITRVQVCPPDKKVSLDGYDDLPNTIDINHFVCLIEPNKNSLSQQYLASRFNDYTKYFIKTLNKDNHASTFIQTDNIYTVFNLIRGTPIHNQIKSLNSLLIQQEARLDSLIVTSGARKSSNPMRGIKSFVSYGTFTKQYQSGASGINIRQGFESPSIYSALSIQYLIPFDARYYYGLGVDVQFFNSSIYSKTLNQIKIDESLRGSSAYFITPYNPLASTTFRHFGLNGCVGYTNGPMSRGVYYDVSINFGAGKMLSNSTADFLLVPANGRIYGITNTDYYFNNFSFFASINPSLRANLNPHYTFITGVSLGFGYSSMPNITNYTMINNEIKYSALEKSASSINFQSLSLNIGFIYTP